MTGDLTVISGPSGVGKGTVVHALASEHPEVWISVSATTRPPRPGEEDGVDYFFVSEAEFDELIASDGLLEWALVHGSARYGTPRAAVMAAVAAGRRVILEIELQGARQVRVRLPGARYIFLAPPDDLTLGDRLRGRGTETEEQVQRRLRTAAEELAAAGEFDHVVVNDDLGQAVAELVELLGL
ncbi:guanylate kinase [Propionicimonas sp.]|uniref:guanylate kinase n=1 Tax=Propionicimonas sp. TaxID=1955623 RepID=UPI00180CFC0C|nr:guanylate kinase [Propionicimonas sp.]MBU3977363.1 guanylate kinase [Actinomycetota bacterium]MBA3021287.1 guanylate kinase [Propionicimonas sp.]MBU3985873.1 guanylate kinase [Actinomycetota bacterium]MBU4008658.1 guanylate kinase [Actinomycetota bacterium]MBU4066192.1 guanylate kinase [Actinomycetota bacterium]